MPKSPTTSAKSELLRLLEEKAKRREKQVALPLSRDECERLTRDFTDFAVCAWPLIQPGVTLIVGVAFRAICAHLQAIAEGRLEKLLINVPPGNSKSSLVSVLFPCWLWARRPATQIMCASHGKDLALRDSVRRRDYVLASPWFQARWGDKIHLLESQQTKTEFLNTAGGYMFSTSIGGDVLGRRAEVMILDDPHKVQEAESEVERANVTQWLNLEWATRRNRNAPLTGEVCVMQRLHEQDAAGVFLKQGGWTHLRLPMYFESANRSVTSIGWADPRTSEREVLDPALNGDKARADLEMRLGPYGIAGQFQQRPAPLEGGLFKASWFRRYTTLPDGRLETSDKRIAFDFRRHLRFCTVDLAMTEAEVGGPKKGMKDDPDYTVMSAWSVFMNAKGLPVLFLLDVIRERLEGPAILARMKAFDAEYDFAVIGVEAVQGQSYIFHFAAKEGLKVRRIDRSKKDDTWVYIDGDKTARAVAATPLMADGRFWVPEHASWLETYLTEMLTFPNAAHNDCVDVSAYSVAIAEKFTGKSWIDEMKRLAPTPSGGILSKENGRRRDDVREDRRTVPTRWIAKKPSRMM